MVLMKLLSTARYKVQQVHGYHADQLQSSDPILSRAPQRLRGKCRCKSEDEESEDVFTVSDAAQNVIANAHNIGLSS